MNFFQFLLLWNTAGIDGNTRQTTQNTAAIAKLAAVAAERAAWTESMKDAFQIEEAARRAQFVISERQRVSRNRVIVAAIFSPMIIWCLIQFAIHGTN